MDWRPFLFIYKVVKLPEYFEKWRESVLKESLRICKRLEKIPRKNTTAAFYHMREGVIRLPKTMIRLTRQMCDCDEYCTEYSLYNTKFSENCKFYDLKNLMGDDKYYRSVLQYRKVINQHLEHEDLKINDEEISAALYNGIWDLCSNKKDSFLKLKCKIYDLKDHCRRDEDCYNNILKKKSPYAYSEYLIHNHLCDNPRFFKELKAIETKFDLPEFYANIKSKKNMVRFQRSLDYQISENNIIENNISENNISENNISENNISENNISDHNVSDHNVSENNISDHNVSDNANFNRLTQVPLLLSLMTFFLVYGKNYKIIGLVILSIIGLMIEF